MWYTISAGTQASFLSLLFTLKCSHEWSIILQSNTFNAKVVTFFMLFYVFFSVACGEAKCAVQKLI